MSGETVEEIFKQLALQIADQDGLYPVLVDEIRPPTEVHGHHGQRFVHGEHEVSGTIDANPVTEGLGEKLAEDDADVLHRVMLIDVEVARGDYREIEATVLGEELQHVVKEPHARRNLVAALAVDVQRRADLRLFCNPFDISSSHCFDFSN